MTPLAPLNPRVPVNPRARVRSRSWRGRRLTATLAVALVAGPLAACGSSSSSSSGAGSTAGTTITLVTHSSFAYTPAVLDSFTARTGIKVEVLKGGDAGEVLAKAVLTKGKPEGDVLFGVDNTLASRAVKEKVFEPYQATDLAKVDKAAVALVPGHEMTPIDEGDVCVNIDPGAYRTANLPPPATLDDLVLPANKDKLVVENPATSSPGLAFLLATVAAYGTGWPDYWRKLRANGVEVVDGWEQAYNNEFSGSAGKGPKPLVVSYASSPVAEVVFAPDPKPTTTPTAVMSTGCFRQVEFAGVLRGTKHQAAARQLVDFLLGADFQADMPLQMFVSPVRADVTVPADYVAFTAKITPGKTVSPADIDANRDAWIAQWTKIVVS